MENWPKDNSKLESAQEKLSKLDYLDSKVTRKAKNYQVKIEFLTWYISLKVEVVEWEHMIYPQSFKVSLMHTNFVTRSLWRTCMERKLGKKEDCRSQQYQAYHGKRRGFILFKKPLEIYKLAAPCSTPVWHWFYDKDPLNLHEARLLPPADQFASWLIIASYKKSLCDYTPTQYPF